MTAASSSFNLNEDYGRHTRELQTMYGVIKELETGKSNPHDPRIAKIGQELLRFSQEAISNCEVCEMEVNYPPSVRNEVNHLLNGLKSFIKEIAKTNKVYLRELKEINSKIYELEQYSKKMGMQNTLQPLSISLANVGYRTPKTEKTKKAPKTYTPPVQQGPIYKHTKTAINEAFTKDIPLDAFNTPQPPALTPIFEGLDVSDKENASDSDGPATPPTLSFKEEHHKPIKTTKVTGQTPKESPKRKENEMDVERLEVSDAEAERILTKQGEGAFLVKPLAREILLFTHGTLCKVALNREGKAASWEKYQKPSQNKPRFQWKPITIRIEGQKPVSTFKNLEHLIQMMAQKGAIDLNKRV